MAQAELLDLGSPVNEEGLTLRLDLDQQVRRCFYVVPQVMGEDGSFTVSEVCPKCSNQLSEYEAGRFIRLICNEDTLVWVNP
jgi:predicted  nucleic acid-binding Zn ribbon protein